MYTVFSLAWFISLNAFEPNQKKKKKKKKKGLHKMNELHSHGTWSSFLFFMENNMVDNVYETHDNLI